MLASRSRASMPRWRMNRNCQGAYTPRSPCATGYASVFFMRQPVLHFTSGDSGTRPAIEEKSCVVCRVRCADHFCGIHAAFRPQHIVPNSTHIQ